MDSDFRSRTNPTIPDFPVMTPGLFVIHLTNPWRSTDTNKTIRRLKRLYYTLRSLTIHSTSRSLTLSRDYPRRKRSDVLDVDLVSWISSALSKTSNHFSQEPLTLIFIVNARILVRFNQSYHFFLMTFMTFHYLRFIYDSVTTHLRFSAPVEY
ncbi:hypothetical protein F5880DRAFT_1603263 [Lentinula raphanica]|nr:hypothetical protein F5880DRAFT_1603263 [Lentinula raphanica]